MSEHEHLEAEAGPVTESVLSDPIQEKKPRNLIKKLSMVAGLILVIYLLYSVLHIFISPDKSIKQIYLVPQDAAFIIQTFEPVEDWKTFSSSPAWQCLKNAASVSEISMHMDALDSVVHSNKALLSLVGKRDMLISVHQTKPRDWDFLIVLDMQKTSKVNLLKDQIETILKLAGYSVTQRKHSGVTVMELLDEETRETLYMAFVENHLVLSYTSKLVTASIDASADPVIGLEESYLEAEKLVGGKGLFRLFVNYRILPRFMSIYLSESNEYIDLFATSMAYAGLYLNSHKKGIEIEGHTLRKDTADAYVTALLNSGKKKMKAHEIMSARTAFYANIGFDNPVTFIKELENAYLETDKAAYDAYLSSRKKIEGLFGISLEENFLSWMSGEIAVGQLEPGLLGREPELILAIRAKSIKEARKNMEQIEKKIRKRTPIKIKTVEYKKYEINYVEMKGFFRLFFGKLFDKFEKPYYTYVDDYLVLSNKSSALLSFIEDYEQKNLLKNEEGFKKAYAPFKSASTLFLYADMHKFYPQMRTLLNSTARADLQANQEILYSFPYWTLQVLGDGESASMKYVMEYEPYQPADASAEEQEADEDEGVNAEKASDRQLMNELKRFYVEKFQGNVYREFYPGGVLKSESEIKEGKRHGRHREYYESGALKARGRYIGNLPKGTWKYYTEEGKFERKEKF